VSSRAVSGDPAGGRERWKRRRRRRRERYGEERGAAMVRRGGRGMRANMKNSPVRGRRRSSPVAGVDALSPISA